MGWTGEYYGQTNGQLNFANSANRHVCDVRNSQLKHDFLTPVHVIVRVISPFRRKFLRNGEIITHSTMYKKGPFCSPEMPQLKISSVACGFSPIEIDYSNYPKSFTSRINED